MELRHILGTVALASVGLLVMPAASAQEGAKPAASAPKAAAGTVAVVNGVKIPESRVDLVMRDRVAQGQQDTPDLRRAIKESLITQEALAQEAAKKGLEKRADVADQLELARQQVLVRAYLSDYVKEHPVAEDKIRAEYDRRKTLAGDKEYKARHILVEKEADAKAIVAQIKKGAKFDKLAAEKSKDTGSAAKGGELDWSIPATFVKPFADSLTSLKKGQMTDAPVQTQFGWHVIKLDDVRPAKIPAYEEVKDSLSQQLQQVQLQGYLQEVRSKAKVE